MLDYSRLIPSDVKKIAVLRPNAVGDFVFSLPCLHALRSRYSEARITYIGQQWHADFLANRPGPVDEVAVIPPYPGVGTPFDADVNPEPLGQFIERMRAAEFDLALQIYGGGRYSNPLIKQFGARFTIGLKADHAEPLDRWISFDHLQNRRLQLLEVAALADASTLRIGNELQVTENDRQETARIFSFPLSKPLIVLQPGARDRRRRWSAMHFAAVADQLAKEGALIAVNGTKQEASVVCEVIERMDYPALDLSDKLSLSGLCGLLERATLLISNDTGPLHLALAIGTPCVGIYWLTNLFESAPLRQSGHKPAVSMRIQCPVCGEENLKTRCPHDSSFVDDVSPEEVIELAMDLFNRRSADVM